MWSKACEKSFKELKDRLTSAPVLILLEGNGGLVVYCDAYRVGLGYFLMKHGEGTAYASRQHKVHEKNYARSILLKFLGEINLRYEYFSSLGIYHQRALSNYVFKTYNPPKKLGFHSLTWSSSKTISFV